MEPPYPTRSCQLLGWYLAIELTKVHVFEQDGISVHDLVESRHVVHYISDQYKKLGLWFLRKYIIFFVWILLMKYWTYSNFKQSNIHSHLCLFVQVLTKWDAADGWWFVSPLILSADGGRWTTKLVNPWESVMFEPQLKITFFRL